MLQRRLELLEQVATLAEQLEQSSAPRRRRRRRPPVPLHRVLRRRAAAAVQAGGPRGGPRGGACLLAAPADNVHRARGARTHGPRGCPLWTAG